MKDKEIPIQYKIGDVNFCGFTIKVDKRVLIPRFETEFLVDKTIKYAKKIINKDKYDVIDLGTGSGCIAISMKKLLNCNVTAIDLSSDALDLARENAKLNDVNINFINDDMTNVPAGNYDIIISNPPYIPKNGFVEDIVKDNEPHMALFAEENGLYFYKRILEYAFNILNKPGIIAFEIGDNEREELTSIVNKLNKKYVFEKDLAGLDRYLFIFNE